MGILSRKTGTRPINDDDTDKSHEASFLHYITYTYIIRSYNIRHKPSLTVNSAILAGERMEPVVQRSRKSPLAILPAILIGLAVIGTPLLNLTTPVAGDEVAAVFPPGWEEADVLLATASADGRLVRFGSFSNIGIIRIDSEETLAGLRAQGALLLLHPQALGGCLIQLPGTSTPTQETSTLQWSL